MFSLSTISNLQSLKTPFYYYDLALLKQTLSACKQASEKYNFHVHYALKANFNQRILSIIQKFGFGADCVSGNEVNKALKTGFNPSQVVFAGVGKSDEEISESIHQNIFCFNIESLQELELIDQLARKQNKIVSISIRINPNIDAHTHKSITTGLSENKFGIHLSEVDDCIHLLTHLKNLKFIGLHFHIGSQIHEMDVFKNLCIKVNEIQEIFSQQQFEPEILNLGGGLGVSYLDPDQDSIPNFNDYFQTFDQFLKRKSGQEVHFELGRSLVAQCGTLVSRVLYIKNGGNKQFLILDAGMTELIRPALYQSYHKIENISKTENSINIQPYDVVGPICETTDSFGEEIELPQSSRGDLITIRTVGAYGEVLASRYNLRDPIRIVYSEALESAKRFNS